MQVVLRLLLPLCLYIYDAWLRNQKTVVNGLRKQLGPAVFAVLSLSSLSGQFTVVQWYHRAALKCQLVQYKTIHKTLADSTYWHFVLDMHNANSTAWEMT